MTGLPKGWTAKPLGELGIWSGGGTPSKAVPEYWADGSIPWVSPKDMKVRIISASQDKITEAAVQGSATQLIAERSVLIVTRSGILAHSVPVALTSVPLTVNQDIKAITPCTAVDPDFMLAALEASRDTILDKCRKAGTTVESLDTDRLKALPIPLPPLPEQRRIVRKLDTLSARSTTARTHLTAIEKLVERYKSGVLGLELSGVPLGNEADEQNTQPITNDNERGAWTFEALPTHWVWTGFKAFLENQTDSYRKLPQKDYQSEGEYPVIDQGADLIGGYSNDATLLLPAEPPYIIFGDHTRCVKFFEAPFVQGADGVKIFHAGKDVDIRFAYWALKGLQLPDKGYSRHAKFLKESYFPRPPIDEQREIVRRIEAAFAKIDRLKAEASAALKLLGHLDGRILAKAFAGDLVPQDPTDEPAETLLARIRESRAAAPKSRRRRK